MITNFEAAPCVPHVELFMSVAEHDGAAKVRDCKAICQDCPSHLAEACLALGTEDGEVLDGVFGGLSKAERLALLPKPVEVAE
jgi:hypothetical protein